MPALPKEISPILTATSPILRIKFPTEALTAPGQKISKIDAQLAPTLALTSVTTSKSFICISVDPDAPFPFLPFLSPILHDIQLGLMARETADNEGYFELEASEAPTVPWLAPAPPPLSPPHRYVFMLYEQPEGLTNEKIRQGMGWEKDITLGKRVRWDIQKFVDKFELGDVVGGNWFVCG